MLLLDTFYGRPPEVTIGARLSHKSADEGGLDPKRVIILKVVGAGKVLLTIHFKVCSTYKHCNKIQ